MTERGEVQEAIVLVSNTERHFGAAVTRQLRAEGWEVCSIPGAREALEGLPRIRPRWVVTCLDEGDEDGFEFIDALGRRAEAAGLEAPEVVVCTRQLGLVELEPATWRTLGIARVVERPCRLEVIGAALRALVAARGELREDGAGEAARACAGAEVSP